MESSKLKKKSKLTNLIQRPAEEKNLMSLKKSIYVLKMKIANKITSGIYQYAIKSVLVNVMNENVCWNQEFKSFSGEDPKLFHRIWIRLS